MSYIYKKKTKQTNEWQTKKQNKETKNKRTIFTKEPHSQKKNNYPRASSPPKNFDTETTHPPQLKFLTPSTMAVPVTYPRGAGVHSSAFSLVDASACNRVTNQMPRLDYLESN